MLRLCQAHFLCYSVHCRYCVTRYSNGNRRVLVKIYDHYMLRTEKVVGIPHPVALLDELFLHCQEHVTWQLQNGVFTCSGWQI